MGTENPACCLVSEGAGCRRTAEGIAGEGMGDESDNRSLLVPVHPYPPTAGDNESPPVLRMSVQDDPTQDAEDEKGYGAEHLTSIILPITITMALVCAVVQTLKDT